MYIFGKRPEIYVQNNTIYTQLSYLNVVHVRRLKEPLAVCYNNMNRSRPRKSPCWTSWSGTYSLAGHLLRFRYENDNSWQRASVVDVSIAVMACACSYMTSSSKVMLYLLPVAVGLIRTERTVLLLSVVYNVIRYCGRLFPLSRLEGTTRITPGNRLCKALSIGVYTFFRNLLYNIICIIFMIYIYNII